MIRILQGWQQMLREAMDGCANQHPPEMPAVLPAGIVQTHLYALLNQNLWDRCLAYLRTHLDARAAQRGTPRQPVGVCPWRRRIERILRTVPADGPYRAIAESYARPCMSRSPVSKTPALSAELLRALPAKFGIEQFTALAQRR